MQRKPQVASISRDRHFATLIYSTHAGRHLDSFRFPISLLFRVVCCRGRLEDSYQQHLVKWMFRISDIAPQACYCSFSSSNFEVAILATGRPEFHCLEWVTGMYDRKTSLWKRLSWKIWTEWSYISLADQSDAYQNAQR